MVRICKVVFKGGIVGYGWAISSKKIDTLVFYLLFAAVYATRVLVIAQVIDSSALTILIQAVYLAFVGTLWLLELNKGIYRPTAFSGFVVLLASHIVLFCYVFTNPRMPGSLGIGQTMVLFFLVVVFTAWYVRDRNIHRGFCALCFHLLGIILTVQLFTHFGDVNLSGLSSLFSADQRVRTVFGFGHPNTLGGMCVALFMMFIFMNVCEERRGQGWFIISIDFGLLAVALLMLLCSASRSSLIGLALLIAFYCSGRLKTGGKYSRLAYRVSRLVLLMAIAYAISSVLGAMSLDSAIVQSNRLTLLDHALPELFRSGRLLVGLGYVSNSSYGMGLTPYNTLWLDNSYVYYLVATGVIGFVLILGSVFCLSYGCLKSVEGSKLQACVQASLISYLFMAFFEVVLLVGNPLNYFLLPFLLSLICTNSDK